MTQGDLLQFESTLWNRTGDAIPAACPEHVLLGFVLYAACGTGSQGNACAREADRIASRPSCASPRCRDMQPTSLYPAVAGERPSIGD